MKIIQVTLHKGFAKVHYSDGGKLIVSVNNAMELAKKHSVEIVAA